MKIAINIMYTVIETSVESILDDLRAHVKILRTGTITISNVCFIMSNNQTKTEPKTLRRL